jgi:hypothetical protein
MQEAFCPQQSERQTDCRSAEAIRAASIPRETRFSGGVLNESFKENLRSREWEATVDLNQAWLVKLNKE